MGDNFDFTEGSGKTGAADDVSGVLFAKVKLDLGTDGVSAPVLAGAGAVATGVQRVTLASDDPAVAKLGTIDTDTGVIAGDTTSIDGKITACDTGAVVLATGSAAIGKLAANSGVDIGDVTLTAGTAAIGKLAANTGVDIGDVDVTSVIAGVGATNLGKARDSALGATDTGVMALAVRDDALTTLTPADGDYVPLRVSSTGQLHVTGAGDGTEYTEDIATANPQVGGAIMMERDDALTTVTPVEADWIGLRGTAEGALWTQDFNSDAVLSDTNAMVTDLAAIEVLLGTMDTDTGNIVTAVQLIDDAVYVDDADWTDGSSKHILVGGLYQSSPQSITDGDVGPLQVDADGALHISDGGNTITVDGTVTSNLSATDNAVLDTIDAVLDQIELNTDPLLVVGGGAEAAAIRVTIANDSTGLVSIDDGGGAITVDGTVTANLSATDNAVLDTIDAVLDTINAKLVTGTVIGDVNLGATDNAVLDAIAASLVTIDSDTNAIKTATEKMDDWDAVHDSAASSDGSQLMGAYDSTKPTAVGDGDAVRVLTDSYGRLLPGLEPEWFNAVYDSADATAEAEVVKAATAAKKIYIMSYIISSDIEGWIKLQDEDSNALTGKFWLKAGGGVAITLPPGAPLVLNVANKALEVIAEAAGNVSVTVTGYLAP